MDMTHGDPNYLLPARANLKSVAMWRQSVLHARNYPSTGWASVILPKTYCIYYTRLQLVRTWVELAWICAHHDGHLAEHTAS